MVLAVLVRPQRYGDGNGNGNGNGIDSGDSSGSSSGGSGGSGIGGGIGATANNGRKKVVDSDGGHWRAKQ